MFLVNSLGNYCPAEWQYDPNGHVSLRVELDPGVGIRQTLGKVVKAPGGLYVWAVNPADGAFFHKTPVGVWQGKENSLELAKARLERAWEVLTEALT